MKELGSLPEGYTDKCKSGLGALPTELEADMRPLSIQKAEAALRMQKSSARALEPKGDSRRVATPDGNVPGVVPDPDALRCDGLCGADTLVFAWLAATTRQLFKRVRSYNFGPTTILHWLSNCFREVATLRWVQWCLLFHQVGLHQTMHPCIYLPDAYRLRLLFSHRSIRSSVCAMGVINSYPQGAW